jgi:hypothetical protein
LAAVKVTESMVEGSGTLTPNPLVSNHEKTPVAGLNAEPGNNPCRLDDVIVRTLVFHTNWKPSLIQFLPAEPLTVMGTTTSPPGTTLPPPAVNKRAPCTEGKRKMHAAISLGSSSAGRFILDGSKFADLD